MLKIKNSHHFIKIWLYATCVVEPCYTSATSKKTWPMRAYEQNYNRTKLLMFLIFGKLQSEYQGCSSFFPLMTAFPLWVAASYSLTYYLKPNFECTSSSSCSNNFSYYFFSSNTSFFSDGKVSFIFSYVLVVDLVPGFHDCSLGTFASSTSKICFPLSWIVSHRALLDDPPSSYWTVPWDAFCLSSQFSYCLEM